MSRRLAIAIALAGFLFNEWAFRFIFPLPPIDSFLRLMTLVLDGFVLLLVVALFWKNTSVKDRLQHLLKEHEKAVLIFIGGFVSFCLVMFVEFGCRYYFKHLYEAPYTEQTYWEPSAIVRDSILGSALARDTTISHAYVINDSLIYKQYYRIDSLGRRINPPTHADSAYNEFIMVTGCSFAFGYGLPEDQTLSYFLDSLTGERTYNYAVSGHGTQQTLALLQSRNIRSEVGRSNGLLVHLFIDDHIPRLVGSRRLIKLWAQNYPYYYLDGDDLIRNGSFWSGRHWLSRFYRAISESAFIGLFDIDIPWYVSNSHLKLFGAVLEETKAEFLKEFPNGKVLVVIGPNSRLAARVSSVLSERGIDCLDVSNLLDKEQKQYKIHWTEGHPNGKYYLEVAQEIDRFLATSKK